MFLKQVILRFIRIYSYRGSLIGMAVKQFKAKYAGSLLGVLWTLVNPVLTMLVITFVFSFIIKTDIESFALFVLAGILPWVFFSGALSEAVSSLNAQKNVLHQFSLPKEIIPLSVVISHAMSFLMSWLVIYPFFIMHNPRIWVFAVLLPLVFILTFLFTAGLAMFFSVLNVVHRDLEHLTGTLLMLWFWMTPVFYTTEMVPQSFRWVFNFNPLTAFILFYREILFYCRLPETGILWGVVIWACLVFLSGVLVSVWFEPKVMKRV